ncbi:hypothetical protein HYALB_00000644 [Hymenoscyphus albidus]|uniref:Carrier domain-containing protein n=1 Tax=Hymenoscyphus albidus TaxID=595503 RepID=A0A9N9Q839_9HELO|nr:hypothetical protein HYALB_00000644 [Hymenoscyphus albidus]
MSLIPEEDLKQIWSWNSTSTRTTFTCVQDLITETARKQPLEPAICAWDGDLDYAQLLFTSSQISEYMNQLGILPGKVLPLWMKKSKWMPVTTLGVLKAGYGIALLDWNIPQERLRGIIESLDSPLVLTTSDSYPSLVSTVRPLLVDKLRFEKKRDCLAEPVSTTRLDSSNQAGTNTFSSARRDQVAAIVFTSGSTGSPKGVILDQECLSTTAVYGSKLFELGQASRVFQFASYSFDISLHETLMTLVAGGCLCIPSESERLNNTISAINSFRANWLCITPSAALALLNDAIISITHIVFTGETITGRICKFLDTYRVFSWYGASEVPLVSVQMLTKDSWRYSQIGPGNPGVCWVVKPDDHEILCAIGEIGELLVEGPMQTRGYLKSPDLTKAALITDPGWLTQGCPDIIGRSGTLYKTGDLVRLNSDGSLMHISRKDTMVKIRGQRVELGEIEREIWKILDSRLDFSRDSGTHNVEVAVHTIQSEGDENLTLVAFIFIGNTTKDESERITKSTPIICVADQSFKELRTEVDSRIRQILPAYMVPSVYFQLQSLPMTPSGKIDRGLLRRLTQNISLEDLMACRVSSEPLVKPIDETEQALLGLWASILGIDKSLISTDASFSHYGGDSLKATTLAKVLKREFDLSTKVPTLTRKETTIQHLANLVSGKAGDEEHVDMATELEKWTAALKDSCSVRSSTKMPLVAPLQVLLTGATGYLGTQILNQLINTCHIGNITVIVRGEGVQRAKQRIEKIARISGWWTNSASRHIDTWIGDLAKPCLGLSEERWSRISQFDIIIHNGAVVSWGTDYHSLEAVNVKSTFQILRTCLQSEHLRQLIYVSGGVKREKNQPVWGHRKMLNDADGYSQTKYISEQLTLAAGQLYLERARADTPRKRSSGQSHSDKNFTVIKPGYIIGDNLTGISNVDDFLWKVVAGAVRMQSYPLDPPDSWLDLAEVTYVASVIVHKARIATLSQFSPGVSNSSPNGDSNKSNDSTNSYMESDASTSTNANSILFEDIDRGLPVSRFWAAVQAQTSIDLKPKDWSLWIKLAHQDMELETEAHPLWGVQQFLGPTLGSPSPHPRESNQYQHDQQSVLEVEAAVRRCVQYLIDVNFISIPAISSPTRKGKRQIMDGNTECEQNGTAQDQENRHHQVIGRSKFMRT